MDSRERLDKAIDVALTALAEVYAKTEAEAGSEVSEERIGEIAKFTCKAIKTSPEQFYDTDLRGEVSLPFDAIVTLVAAIHTLQFDNFHLKNCIENLEAAVRVPPPTKREMNNLRKRAALFEYERLVEGGKYDPVKQEVTQPLDKDDALNLMALKYKKKPGAMRKALSRELKALNEQLESEGKAPAPIKLPWRDD